MIIDKLPQILRDLADGYEGADGMSQFTNKEIADGLVLALATEITRAPRIAIPQFLGMVQNDLQNLVLIFLSLPVSKEELSQTPTKSDPLTNDEWKEFDDLLKNLCEKGETTH
jgi:hypothetical protein